MGCHRTPEPWALCGSSTGRFGAKKTWMRVGGFFAALLSLEVFGPDAARQKYLGFVSEARRGARNRRETPKAGIAARAGRGAAWKPGRGAPRSPPLPATAPVGTWPLRWCGVGGTATSGSGAAKGAPMQPLRPMTLQREPQCNPSDPAPATTEPQNILFGGRHRPDPCT